MQFNYVYDETNKNNLVVKFLLVQVQMGVLQSVDYKFFIKGLTRNSRDRGFGHIHKYLARQDCWTMGHILTAAKDAAVFNRTVYVFRDDGFFESYKPLVSDVFYGCIEARRRDV
uniref:DUF7869 domain-containing protein n=1 Tax=Phytophthora ramorum TaxID=164328 RepID=H3GNW0_PHYRM